MIKILCVGSMKDKNMLSLQNDYLKRILPFHKIEIVEVKEANPSFEEYKIIQKEGEFLLNLIKPQDYVMTLDLSGKSFDSSKFSNWIENKLTKYPSLVFVIGGSLGLSMSVKQRANESLCLSNMTFPHLLARIIILEQIYRGFKILNNQTYHK